MGTDYWNSIPVHVSKVDLNVFQRGTKRLFHYNPSYVSRPACCQPYLCPFLNRDYPDRLVCLHYASIPFPLYPLFGF